MLIVRTILFVVLGGYRDPLFVLKKIGGARWYDPLKLERSDRTLKLRIDAP
jgi:hypothetical protein